MVQQTIGIPKGTKFVPLLAGLFLRAYEANSFHELHKNKDSNLIQTFNSNFRYIDDVLLLKYFLDLGRNYIASSIQMSLK